jgi:hypothetical protein
MTTSLGGVTLRDPDSPLDNIYRVFVGDQTEAHDGTLITQYTAEKLAWKLRWTLLTQAERDTIITQAEVRTAQTFSPPHTTATYSVVVKVATLVETPMYMADGAIRYQVSFDVEEAS